MIIFLLIAIFFCFLYTALIIYYRFCWTSIPLFKPDFAAKSACTSISVIIPARNEAQHIGPCIESVLNGTYPPHLFQIIVVDDYSEDDTPSLVNKYAGKNLQLIYLKDYAGEKLNSYKKKAIETGISKATGQLIVTTDADCILPAQWLENIAAFYEEKNSAFIAAPVVISSRAHPHKKSFIEIFQTLDFMTLQGITGSVVDKKQMTMCNGANMAYERSAFYETGGFSGIDAVASGDDMLLMHKIFKQYPQRVHFLKSAAAIVTTQPVQTIKQFFNQRIRWASKADKYDDKRILPVLVLVYFFNVIMLAMPVAALVNAVAFPLPKNIFLNLAAAKAIFFCWLILLTIKIIAELFFIYPVAKFFGRLRLLFWFPVMQPFHILYTVIAGWLGKFGSYVWKDRTVK